MTCARTPWLGIAAASLALALQTAAVEAQSRSSFRRPQHAGAERGDTTDATVALAAASPGSADARAVVSAGLPRASGAERRTALAARGAGHLVERRTACRRTKVPAAGRSRPARRRPAARARRAPALPAAAARR